MAPKAKKRRTEVFANLKSFWQCCLFFCKESQLLHDSNWNGRWMKSSLLNVCFMHGYKSNTPFSVKWLSYTFLAPSFVGIQIVREINTCGCITQEGNGSQRFHKVVKPFLKEHYNFHENFLQSSYYPRFNIYFMNVLQKYSCIEIRMLIQKEFHLIVGS